jgi:signal transduction histidine kinase
MSNENVLVVDDNPSLLRSLDTLLKRWKYKTHLAADSKEAIQTFKRTKPGVVLIDVVLPGSNGITTIQKMKEINNNFSSIVMTGNPAQEFVLRGLKAGASDILVKPFSASQLKNSIDHALSTKNKWSKQIVQNQCIAKMIQSKTEQLTLMKKELFQLRKMATVGELTAGLVHEINQPLGSLILNCQEFMLRTDETSQLDSKEMKPLLEEMLAQMDLIAKIVRNMRSFSRGAETNAFEKFDLNELIQETLGLISNQLSKHNIQLEMDLSPNLPLFSGHLVRIQQVIMNLVANARDALSGSEKSIRKIRISTQLNSSIKDDAEFVVCIEDNGHGIPEDIKEKIFIPLFTTKDRDHGTGLGLAISKEIIEEIGGQIDFESQEGQGTQFRFMIPLSSMENTNMKRAA